MNDPERLLHGGASERARRLLEAGIREEPPAGGAARVALALGVSLSELGESAAQHTVPPAPVSASR